MARKYFGTDGIRGEANTPPIEAETLVKLAKATCLRFKNHQGQHKVVIGKDTRLSGYMIEPALTTGFISMGWDVVLLGPVPTPALSMFTRSLRADLGVMISASHNPFCDNGVKFFAADGFKLSDEIEEEIEQILEQDLVSLLPPSEKMGRAKRLEDEIGRYVEFCKATFPRNKRLDGIKIVVDCAHGAAYKAAPQIFWELGAQVISLGVQPNGTNINDQCGATYPSTLAKRVLEEKADIGLAVDGDADRIIFCDEKGQIADGDQIMALMAVYLKEREGLQNKAIVATTMSNMGLEEYLLQQDIIMHRSQVGDRYVLEMMLEKGINFGGEKSGHIINLDYNTTGDALIAALQVLAVYCEKKVKASDLFCSFVPYPQVLKTIAVQNKNCIHDPEILNYVEEIKKTIDGKGRIILRASGTENAIRVMIEGKDSNKVKKTVDDLCDFITNIDKKNLETNVA